jgi:hypothetical protein
MRGGFGGAKLADSRWFFTPLYSRRNPAPAFSCGRDRPRPNPAPLLVSCTCPLDNFSFNFILSTSLSFAAMTEINNNQAAAQSTRVNAPAPTAEAEVQEYVLPPWANGSEPSVPMVDDVDDHVCLDIYGIPAHQNPCAELR